MPVAAISGILLSKLGRYRPLHAAGFGLTTLGLGLNVLLTESKTISIWVILQIINTVGQGLLVSTILPHPSILTTE
jgi:hypothetical protein